MRSFTVEVFTPVTFVLTTLLLLQIFPSLSMSYLYVQESKTCDKKEVSEGGILWTGNGDGNEDGEGDDESDGDGGYN